MKSKQILIITALLLVFTMLPLISAVSLDNQTILFEGVTSNTTIQLQQNTTATSWDINETFGGVIITNLSTDNSIFTNINQTYNATVKFANLPDKWVIKDITNNRILFVSSSANNNYTLTFSPNVQIEASSNITNLAVTIVSPTTADMNFYTPTLSVSLSTYGSCKYNIDNGTNYTMGSGLFLNKVITVTNGQRTVNVICNNSILSTESTASVSFWVYVSSSAVTGGSGSTTTSPSITYSNLSSINLAKMDLSSSDWQYGQSNYINVKTYNDNNELIDPPSLNSYIFINENKIYGHITRNSVGDYRINYNIITGNSTSLNITVIAKDDIKTIDKVISVKMWKQNKLLKTVDIIKKKSYKLYQSKLTTIYIFGFLFFIFVLLLFTKLIWKN